MSELVVDCYDIANLLASPSKSAWRFITLAQMAYDQGALNDAANFITLAYMAFDAVVEPCEARGLLRRSSRRKSAAPIRNPTCGQPVSSTNRIVPPPT